MRMVKTSLLTLALIVLPSVAALAVGVGDAAPNYTATCPAGNEHTLDSASAASDITVLCFTCNGCPVAVAYEDRFIEFAEKYKDKKVNFVALNSNGESAEAMKTRAEQKGYNFVYAADEGAAAAKAYGAKVTPEIFIIKDGKIVYHGSFDDKMKNPERHYVADAVEALLAGKTPEVTETKAFGCGIKLKKK